MSRRSLNLSGRAKLDAYEAETVERSVFGLASFERARRRRAGAGGRDDHDAPAQDDYAVPEADRLFAPPREAEAVYALRELAWGEHLVLTRVSAARGPTLSYLYSLKEAMVFFLDEHPVGASTASRGSFTLVDQDQFVAWLRDVIGDIPLAEMISRRLAPISAYNDRIEELHRLFMLRLMQYAPYMGGQDDSELSELGLGA